MPSESNTDPLVWVLPCAVCNATGRTLGWPWSCNTCDGTGKVRVLAPPLDNLPAGAAWLYKNSAEGHDAIDAYRQSLAEGEKP